MVPAICPCGLIQPLDAFAEITFSRCLRFEPLGGKGPQVRGRDVESRRPSKAGGRCSVIRRFSSPSDFLALTV
jgi:hypothetical protein